MILISEILGQNDHRVSIIGLGQDLMEAKGQMQDTEVMLQASCQHITTKYQRFQIINSSRKKYIYFQSSDYIGFKVDMIYRFSASAS